ncbi:anhydro-N-acetylmuramic acid kinase [Comamonas resistens]|uniref:anhydro-N-acetylmuramic acid kinase n=1 Tax=Comamonas resistens TaxID=3046670 RepID=UPI0039BCEE1C
MPNAIEQAAQSPLYIGLMSGTSLDGVDGVVVDFSQGTQVIQHASCSFDSSLRAELMALNSTGGSDELHRAALAANAVARHYTQVVQQLLQASGLRAGQIAAIGAHGQTVRHRPQMFDGTGYTLQLNSPALLAELTGISVVADLRSRDVAAGGQGAPLVPAFHQSVFGKPGETALVLNIGGIANLSVLEADGSVLGFDTGTGNALLDGWCLRHTGQPYDAGGQWAAGGQILPQLLAAMLADPYLAQTPPKSTGRDLFHADWLEQHLQRHASQAAPVDVQATLTEFTAASCADAVQRFGKGGTELLVCGGGAFNTYLMQRLAALLPGVQVGSTAQRGLPPLEVEAAAFAWLARQCLLGLPGNLASVTGARGPRIPGAIYPA